MAFLVLEKKIHCPLRDLSSSVLFMAHRQMSEVGGGAGGCSGRRWGDIEGEP